MTLDQYAQVSNFAAGSAFVVLFLAFLVHIAEWYAAHRTRAEVTVPQASGVEVLQDEPAAADRLSGVGVSLTGLGTLLLVVAVVTRGIAAERWPMGNMYEFGLVGVSVAL